MKWKLEHESRIINVYEMYLHSVASSCEMQMAKWHLCRQLSTLFKPCIFSDGLKEMLSSVGVLGPIVLDYKKRM